jgi:hypothetical protein
MNVLKKNKSDSDSSDSSSSDSSDDEDLPPVKRKIMPRITIERGTRYLEMIKREEKERLEELQKPKEKETPKYREVQREAQRETPKNKEPKEKISIIMAQVKNEQIKNRNKKFTKSRFRKGGKKRELVDSAHSGLKSHTSKVVKRGHLRRTVRKGVAPLVRLLAEGQPDRRSVKANR